MLHYYTLVIVVIVSLLLLLSHYCNMLRQKKHAIEIEASKATLATLKETSKQREAQLKQVLHIYLFIKKI